MKKIILPFLVTALCGNIYANSYSGRVYVDINNNGKYDKGEKLLKDVMVSDGLNVVKTSSKGDFSLQGHSKQKFIFITTPSGYKSVEYYKRISDGVTEYDFGVVPYKSNIGTKGEHSFVHISDTEISTSVGQDDWVNDLRTYSRNEKASFIVHTGDICYENGLKSHKPMLNTENMDVPVYYCIGNHDLVKGNYGEEVFESIYGPVYYSFNVGSVHYIVTPMWGGDYRPSYTREDVYNWLKNDLSNIKKGTPIVIFNHDYWTTENRHVFSAGSDKTIDLDSYNLKAWIYGHVHINHITKHDKVLAVCTSTLARGGIDHATSAFRKISIDSDENIHSELRYTYIDKSVEFASIQNGYAPVTKDGNVMISLNAYSSVSPVRNVNYQCFLYGKEISAVRRMTQKSDMNWYDELSLPEKCNGKTITVKAVVSFSNGETAVRESYFKYLNSDLSGKVSGNWQNLCGNAQHVGIAGDTLSTPYNLAWVKNMGSNVYMSSPIVYKGKVFSATIDENACGKSCITAMNAEDGDIIWKYNTRASVKNTIATCCGLVFAQDVYGYLYAVDAESGKLRWEKKLDVVRVPGLNDGIVVSDNVVFAGSGKGLCAVDALTGNELWKNNSWSQREGTTVTLSLSPNEKILISGVQWGAMYANDALTGKLLWSKSENGIRNRASSPAMFQDGMYFLSLNSLFILSSRTGEILLQKELPYSVDVTSTPLVTKEEIIFGTATEGLVALDRNTLDEKWKFRTGNAMIFTSPYVNGNSSQIECSPILTGDTVIFGSSDGAYYALDRKSGKLLWKHTTGAPVMTTIAVSGSMFFGVDYSGNVYGFCEK